MSDKKLVSPAPQVLEKIRQSRKTWCNPDAPEKDRIEHVKQYLYFIHLKTKISKCWKCKKCGYEDQDLEDSK